LIKTQKTHTEEHLFGEWTQVHHTFHLSYAISKTLIFYHIFWKFKKTLELHLNLTKSFSPLWMKNKKLISSQNLIRKSLIEFIFILQSNTFSLPLRPFSKLSLLLETFVIFLRILWLNMYLYCLVFIFSLTTRTYNSSFIFTLQPKVQKYLFLMFTWLILVIVYFPSLLKKLAT